MSPVVGEVVVVIAVVVAVLLTLHTNSKEPNKLSSHCATCPATSTTSSLSPTVVALVSHCKRATVPEGRKEAKGEVRMEALRKKREGEGEKKKLEEINPYYFPSAFTSCAHILPPPFLPSIRPSILLSFLQAILQ
jgi:hypothetical protein